MTEITLHEYLTTVPEPSTGKLAKIENHFLENKIIKNREKIISLLDHCKRFGQKEEWILELETLIYDK